MAADCTLTFQQQSMVQQGYTSYSPEELRQMAWGLRFTPFVCALMTLYGLVGGHPYLLFFVAGLGTWAFFFPAAHPMDLLYNHVVARLFGAARVPPNPLQRRLACLSAAVMNGATGGLMLAGQMTAAYLVGGLLLVLQAIVISTHFCVLSWLYELVAHLLGTWNRPLEIDEARRLLDRGATVIDVRSPQEFAERHLPGALNFPVETLPERIDALPSGPLLLHCKSGMRSNMAAELLKKHRRSDVYNLGAYERAEQVVATAHAERV